jgi:hypothetical protein
VTATIGREELKAKIDSWGDVVLVETLDPEYYEDAYPPGAVNLPLDRIGELAPEILPDKDADIVVSATGREIRHVDAPPEAARQGMLSSDMPEWQVDVGLALLAATRKDALHALTGTVATVGRVEPARSQITRASSPRPSPEGCTG